MGGEGWYLRNISPLPYATNGSGLSSERNGTSSTTLLSLGSWGHVLRGVGTLEVLLLTERHTITQLTTVPLGPV